MNTPGIINFFASNGFLIDSAALSYIQAHDHKELLQLIQDNEPELIVVNLEAIRRVKRVERKHTIVRYVDCFKPRLALIRKEQSFFEKVRDGLSIHANGGMQK